MRTLIKDYTSGEELRTDLPSVRKSGGLLCSDSQEVASREVVKVSIRLGGKSLAEVDGEVVYVAPIEGGFSVGVELRGEWQKGLDEIDQKSAIETFEGQRKWGKDAESLFHAIAEMSTHEKIQAALKGGKEERRILLKDAHYMVHPYILRNPRITTEEVAQIARMPQATLEMINLIASNTEWMQNMTVRLSLVKNPKTPIPVVQKHIQQVNETDLMTIAKSESVRDAVSKAARRVLASRGKTVR